ncbi:ATP-binding protein [Phenylobacterium sp.]|jgi:signal transduction histidine kinase|uniref:ATP-binding protein n=1 Tax=Phenylobacterium sp. TaxID=1871053 RepID=UPI002E2F05BA|nr:ATP-binding protein [Phenylobacterium sp.]HEX4712116.1 ATP-binding protein [Phenylobacterium sp.]
MILQRYFDSMAGRLFLFLLVGVIGSSSLALALADVRRKSDLERINIVRLVDRVQDLVSLIDSAPEPLRDQMLSEGILGLRPPRGGERIIGPDPEFSRVLASRLDPSSRAQRAVPRTCIQPSRTSFYAQLSCWVISTELADNSSIVLVALSPRTDTFDLPRLDPVFLSILTITVSVLAFLASRMAAAPLRDLSLAARELGRDLDREPLPERGPYEVRDATRAFNLMQAKLRDHVVERTRILASITHDLQTPLTRLRLRIEKVADPALRSRLVDDLGGMLALVRQGLDYHRGNESEEPFVRLALDSLLDSVVEDAAEGGRPAGLVQRSGYDIEGKPRALQRCLANLLDNALKYGGAAEVSATVEGDAVRIRIRDFGPGIPEEKLESVFEPFVRLETARPPMGGVGLGLTIARALALKSEAELVLANHPQGGLEACLTIRRGLIPSEAAASHSSAA